MLGRTPFRVHETHGILTRPQNHIRACSDGYDWTSLYASAQREVPYEGFFPAVKDQLLVLHVDGPVPVERMDEGGPVRRLVPEGGIHLVPGGMDFGVRLLGGLSTLHVYVRRAVIEELAAEMVCGDPARIEIPPQFVDSDPGLNRLLGAVDHALSSDDLANALYVDCLSRAIAALLIRNNSVNSLRQISDRREPGSGRAVRNAVDYMRAHIASSVTLEDIAAAVGSSPSHLARQFRNELAMPPYQYLLKLRLEKARHLLADTRMSIAGIAFECGFSHQEHLTRMFRRRYDVTPAAFRRSARH